MFEQAKKDFPRIDFKNSFIIGDSITDIEAGKKIGGKTVLIYDEERVKSLPEQPDYIFSSLFKAVNSIKSQL